MPLSLCTVNYYIEIAASWNQEWEAFEPTEYVATYRTHEKAPRGKTGVENIGRFRTDYELESVVIDHL